MLLRRLAFPRGSNPIFLDETIAESPELSGFKRNMVLFTRHNESKKENVQPQEEKKNLKQK